MSPSECEYVRINHTFKLLLFKNNNMSTKASMKQTITRPKKPAAPKKQVGKSAQLLPPAVEGIEESPAASSASALVKAPAPQIKTPGHIQSSMLSFGLKKVGNEGVARPGVPKPNQKSQRSR